MAFESTAEQEQVVRSLRAILSSERLPHAFLFVGTGGSGRAAVARELVRVVLCAAPPAPDQYCSECENCRLLDAGSHPDYVEVGVPRGKQFLPILTVREIQRTAALRPVTAGRRFFVVRDAERMTVEAANCFLKTLEEPPGGCVFVLTATGLRTVPETVVSRCRVIRFRNLLPAELQDRLEAEGVATTDAAWLSRRAWGSPGLAQRLKEAGLADVNRELVGRLADLKLEDNFELSDWLAGAATSLGGKGAGGREALQDLLECAALYYRDLAVAACTGESAELFNAGEADRIREAAAAASADQFLERADVVLEAVERIGANSQRRLALDCLFTKLGMLTRGRA